MLTQIRTIPLRRSVLALQRPAGTGARVFFPPQAAQLSTATILPRSPLRSPSQRALVAPLASLTLNPARFSIPARGVYAQKRFASSGSAAGAASAKPEPKEGGLRISHLFGGLVSVGLLVTIYGLLEWYYSLQIWPEPVRTPLKSAIKAKGRGEYERADAFFRLAVNAARSIPPSALEPDPLLKLSGIYVTWAAMLEEHGQPVRAFAALRDAIAWFGHDPLKPAATTTASESAWVGGEPRELTQDEFHRAIGLAQKLGQLAARMGEMGTPPPFPQFVPDAPATLPAAEVMLPPAKRNTEGQEGKDGKELPEEPQEPEVYVTPVPAGLGSAAKDWDAAAETYLSGALTAMLRIGLASRSSDAAGPVVVGRDVSLPHDDQTTKGGEEDTAGRVNRRGLGMTMEALADVYARQKRFDLAAQLLVQAVSTVIPPQATNPSLEDRCQAAMLMTGIASHVLEPHTEQAIRASRSWSRKALELADAAAAEAGWAGVPTDAAHAVCVRARTAAQYNLGMLAELEKNPVAAARYFSAALNTARDAAYTEGRREAADALRRVRAQIEGSGQ